MISVNPDPHKHGYVYFPTRSVTACFPVSENIRPILNSLSAGGFADDEIDKFIGQQGRNQLDKDGDQHGWWVRLRREFNHTFSDEYADLMKIDHTLEDGGSVIAVFTGKDEQKKKCAVEILTAHQGQDVMYWGPWLIERFVK